MADQDSVALVTGGANGIGKATVERFAADDAYDRVAIFDVEAGVNDVAADVPGADAFQLDVRDHEAVADAVDAIESEARIDAVVNNAAVSTYYWLGELEPEEWHRVMDINLTGQYHVLHEAATRMYEREHGYVVNVSSGAGQRGSATGGVHYSASKAGILGLTKGCAKQLSPHVQVNCVVPGLINTRLAKGSDLWEDHEIEAFEERVPAGRMGEPDEVARVINYLCGEGAAYMTGSVVNVDGGGALV